jgi:hypothetical protein
MPANGKPSIAYGVIRKFKIDLHSVSRSPSITSLTLLFGTAAEIGRDSRKHAKNGVTTHARRNSRRE